MEKKRKAGKKKGLTGIIQKEWVKRVIAIIALAFMLGGILLQPLLAMAAGSTYYATSLGSNAALGSPLSNADFDAEDWDKWEIVVFGIFLGNFCELGVDDYGSAFASGSKGLNALQFAAGGDVNSNGILRKMLNTATTAQQSNLAQIQVRYNYWELGEKTALDLGMRTARFNDLIPYMDTASPWGESSFMVKPSSAIENPIVASNINIDNSDTSKIRVGSEEDAEDINVAIACNALLPTFTVSVNGNLKTIFGLDNGYDAQLMSSVIAKMCKKSEDRLKELIEQNPELRFDAFGNICALTGGKAVIVIPASANRNIQKEKEVNLLNSLIVNGLMVGNSQSALETLASEGYPQDSHAWFPDGMFSLSGMPAISDIGDKISKDKLIIYSDTDPLLISDVYTAIKQKDDSIRTNMDDYVKNISKFPKIGQGTTVASEESTPGDEAGEEGNTGGTTDNGSEGAGNTTGTTDNAGGTTIGKVEGLLDTLDFLSKSRYKVNKVAEPDSEDWLPFDRTDNETTNDIIDADNDGVDDSIPFGKDSDSTENDAGDDEGDEDDSSSPENDDTGDVVDNTPGSDDLLEGSTGTHEIGEEQRKQMGSNPEAGKLRYSDISLGSYISRVLDGNSLYSAPFKFEMTGYLHASLDFGTFNKQNIKKQDLKGAPMIALSQISNMRPYYLHENSLTKMMLVNGGNSVTDVDLLNGSYYISPGLCSEVIAGKWNPFKENQTARATKDFAAFAWKNISGANKDADGAGLRARLKELYTPNEIFELMMCMKPSEYQGMGDLDFLIGSAYKTFIKSRYTFKYPDDITKNEEAFMHDGVNFDEVNDYLDRTNSMYTPLYSELPLSTTDAMHVATRVCKVYKPSSAFEAVSKIYDLDNSALFSQYTTALYITYLNWYGVLDNKTDADLRFDTSLFEGKDYLNIDSSDLIDSMTDEEKDKVIKNNMVRMLDTGDSGREYRKNIFGKLAEDLFDTVYETSANGDGLGFLNVSGYKDNMLTSFLLDNYERFADVFFGIMFLLVIIQGILSKRSLSWFIAVEASMLLSVSAVPAYVEIAPYICNNMIQRAFKENALYWLAAEEISNQSKASDMKNKANGFESLTSDNEKKAVVMMNSIRVQQSDKALLAKLDTSKKVIEQLNIGWDELQKKASTRWMVPSLIQQIGGDNGTNDYVYISTYDWFANMTRAYLSKLYIMDLSSGEGDEDNNSEYNVALNSLAGSFFEGEYHDPIDSGLNGKVLSERSRLFGIYKDTSTGAANLGDSYRSISRLTNDEKNVHTYIYFMSSGGAVIPASALSGDSNTPMTTAEWDNLADNATSNLGSALVGLKEYNSNEDKGVLARLNSYNRYDNGIDPSFANLWCTEGIGTYMYALVKDTLPISQYNTESISQALAGSTALAAGENEDNEDGKRVRTSFMHQGNTGYVRDILDLEEVFTNMLPYLYAEQIIMGGNNGENGVLGSDLMGSKYSVYSENLQSWLYRSNWVTKIMSDAKYSKPCEIGVRDASGNRTTIEIKNMVDPRSYPSNRPMVFSEAQQRALNLRDQDLNLLELKLVRINNEVCDEWTKLINLANLEGITAETIERLMTMIATTKFNSIVTRTSVFNTTLAQYPKNIDLRNITWDSLMRHMVVSSSKNSTYLGTNNIMRNIIESCGFFVGIISLLVTCMSASIIPVLRDLLLSLMLLVCLLSIVLNLYNGAKEKIKATTGWALTYTIFACYTAIFYFLIAQMVGNGNTSAILVGNLTSISTTSITFKMVLLLIIDGVYVFGLYKYMKDVVFRGGLSGLKSYMQDGGFGFFYNVASNMASGINNGISGVTKSVQGVSNTVGLYGQQSQKVEIVNSENHNIHTKVTDGEIGSHSINRKNKPYLENDINDSGYIVEEIKSSPDSSRERSEKIAKEITRGMQQIEGEKEQ